MDLGERTGIGREPAANDPPNFALPLGLDVANVTTADPGVQVENVSARGRRTRYQRVPGSLLVFTGFVFAGPAFAGRTGSGGFPRLATRDSPLILAFPRSRSASLRSRPRRPCASSE